jgi:dipeptidyl aminopeptidase/acylaminoacyl peptidase
VRVLLARVQRRHALVVARTEASLHRFMLEGRQSPPLAQNRYTISHSIYRLTRIVPVDFAHMRSVLRPLAMAIVVLVASNALAQDRRPPTIDDLLNLVQVSGAEISPDGKHVIYTKSELKKWSDNKRVTSIWIASADGTDHHQLLSSDKDRSPAWSPDGKYVAFLSTRDQAENARDAAGAQLWLLRMSGGEATKLSDLKSAIRSFKWVEDSSQIFFVTEEAQTEAQKEARKNGDDAIFVDEGPNGQGRASFANAWVIALADKEARQLTTGDQTVTDLAPSPDGKRLAYIARPNNRRNFQNLAEVYVLDLATSTSTRLTENETPEMRIAWSPDGALVSYLASSDKRWDLAQEKLFVQAATRGSTPRLLSGSFAGDIGQYFWNPSGKTIVFSATVRGRRGVHELDSATGQLRTIVSGDMALGVTSTTRDVARAAGTRNTPSDPDEVVVVDLAGGQVSNITAANPWFKQIQTAEMRPITWKSKDGLEIEGLLWLPASHKAGNKLPFLLSIHGGPAGVWATSFRGINHVYTSLGFAVLEPNVRGSTSYGDALLRGNTQDIGGGDYNDLMTGVDAVIAQGIADPTQLALRGWSYGGILGGWTITQTNRFKAASLGAMVSDWSSEYAMGFNHDISRWYIGGRPWDNAEAYRRQSAYTHIAKVATPTLLLHGEQDDTDTIGQSMIFYQGLKDRGVPTRFIRFPREPHGFREPHHIRIRDAEEISWLMKYTRGIDWKAPERKDEKEEKKVTTTASQ